MKPLLNESVKLAWEKDPQWKHDGTWIPGPWSNEPPKYPIKKPIPLHPDHIFPKDEDSLQKFKEWIEKSQYEQEKPIKKKAKKPKKSRKKKEKAMRKTVKPTSPTPDPRDFDREI